MWKEAVLYGGSTGCRGSQTPRFSSIIFWDTFGLNEAYTLKSCLQFFLHLLWFSELWYLQLLSL